MAVTKGSGADDHRVPAGGWTADVSGRLGLVDRADGRLGLQRALAGGVLEQLVRPRRVLRQTAPALGVVHAQVVAGLHVAQTGRLLIILDSLKHTIERGDIKFAMEAKLTKCNETKNAFFLTNLSKRQ